VLINTSAWAQCGRAIAGLLSLKELPEDKTDQSPALSQFRNEAVDISSFLVFQRDMFESVKRVTGNTDADWTVTHESGEKRFLDAKAAFEKGDMHAWAKLIYSRMFHPNGGGNCESTRGTHNKLLGLPIEDLDECTGIAVRKAELGEL
jgi:hypothetical protein